MPKCQEIFSALEMLRDHYASAADILHGALEDVALGLRWEHPEWYAKVDAIQADPDWRSHRGGSKDVSVFEYISYEMRECKWCGDNYAAAVKSTSQCCSPSCGAQYRAWRVRTGRA